MTSPTPALEIVVFRPTPGADLDAMHAASRALNPHLRDLPGFISRHTGVHDDGRWVDVLVWRSIEEAQAAMQKVHEFPACKDFFAFIDPSVDQLDHYRVTDSVA